jgi:hypothetical protein
MGRNLTPEEHTHRLALYSQGLKDAEIAAQVGVRRQNIQAWRKANSLPPHYKGGGYPADHRRQYVPQRQRCQSVPMEQALPPEACKTMRLFWKILLACRNVDLAMKEYRRYNAGQICRFPSRTVGIPNKAALLASIKTSNRTAWRKTYGADRPRYKIIPSWRRHPRRYHMQQAQAAVQPPETANKPA